MLSYLKKFCASAPAPFTAPPGVPTRAWARLVGSGRRHLDVAAPVGRRAGRCGLWSVACAVWLLAVGCGPAAVIGWPWPCGLWLAPAGWWPVVGCIAVLLAVGCAPALRLCWWRLSACALLGVYGGRIYQAPRRLYRARKTPPGAAGRLPGGLFSPSPRCGARGRRRSCHGPPVLPSAGPPVGGPPGAFVGSCLLSAGVLELPAATDRPTENAGENAPDFSGLFAGPLPPSVQVQDAPRLHISRRAGPDRHAGDHAGGRENFQQFFRRGILCARSKSCFLVY